MSDGSGQQVAFQGEERQAYAVFGAILEEQRKLTGLLAQVKEDLGVIRAIATFYAALTILGIILWLVIWLLAR